MHMAIGLGNPGKEYETSRHNVGFQVIDNVARAYGIDRWATKFDSQWAQGYRDGKRFLLLKPQTYMNNSGHAIASVLHYYKIPMDAIVVIVDDIDLTAGKVRLRNSGSDGGHRGLRSIIEHTGSQDFKRIRIGVGRPPRGRSVIAHVLGRGNDPGDAARLDEAIAEAARRTMTFIDRDEFENWSTP